MYIKNWRKEILTVPNLLSLFRLLLIPVYVDLYFRAEADREFAMAAAVMALSCATDAVDGKIARKFNMTSRLGKLLDPMADKFTQLALFLCLAVKYPIIYPVLALFLVKEFFQLFAVFVNLRIGKALPGALMAGKICTAVLFVSLIALVLFPKLNPAAVNFIVLTDAVFLLISFFSYILAYYGKNRKIQDLETE